MIRVRDPKRVALLMTLACGVVVSAQRTNAPVDLTGYWVAVITEDWRWRMLTPPKGDASGVPLNIDGRKAADQWDPARDAAGGESCRAYGAAGIMREPTRLHITWQDDRTLRIDLDAGAQTRMFRFGSAKPGRSAAVRPTWQGTSVASWEGGLTVITTGMRAGYLRKNGVPYSGQARLTEYFDLVPLQPNGDRWLVVSSIVDDPRYLAEPFVTSTHFKREADGRGWHPTPCEARRRLDP
jgi:hypothetical protein